MMAGLVGLFLGREEQRWWFLAGAIAMLVTAAWNRMTLFTTLQAIVLSAILASFLPIPLWIRGLLPMVLCVPVLFLLARAGHLGTWRPRFGAAALLILSVGYAVQEYGLFVIAGLMLCLFSGAEIRAGIRQAWLWLILNIGFVVSAWVNMG